MAGIVPAIRVLTRSDTVGAEYAGPAPGKDPGAWAIHSFRRGGEARRLSPKVLASCFLALLAGIVLAPLASLFVLALRGDAEIWPHLVAYVLPASLAQTAALLAGVALLSGFIGVGSAWLVTLYRFPGREVLLWFLPLPLAMPTYITAYVYADLLEPAGPVQAAWRELFGGSAGSSWLEIRSLPGAIFIMGFVLYPYVYLSARAMFQTQSAALLEVARTLGASRLDLIRHVAVPLARPALAVGLSLALLEALNDIGAAEYLGVRTLTVSIFTTWLNRGSLPAAAQIACVMLMVIAALILLERFGRREQRFGFSARRSRPPAPRRLGGAAAAAALAACAFPILAGFAVPVAFLVREAILRGLSTGFDPDLLGHTVTSIMLALCATALAIALGFAGALALRVAPYKFGRSCLLVASLGYAIPGTILALGLLSPLVAIDETLNVASRVVGGAGVGLLLAGSSAGLVIAYVLRFLTISVGSAQAGLSRIPSHVDDAARTLGAHMGEISRTIHLPLLRPALGGAALLVFVDCLKELPATLLLRPLNVETLPTYVYQFATRGSFEEGALAALLIVAAGVFPVLWFVRYADRSLASAATRAPG